MLKQIKQVKFMKIKINKMEINFLFLLKLAINFAF